MSDFKSQALFEQITEGLKTMDDKEKKDIQKKVRIPTRRGCLPACDAQVGSHTPLTRPNCPSDG